MGIPVLQQSQTSCSIVRLMPQHQQLGLASSSALSSHDRGFAAGSLSRRSLPQLSLAFRTKIKPLAQSLWLGQSSLSQLSTGFIASLTCLSMGKRNSLWQTNFSQKFAKPSTCRFLDSGGFQPNHQFQVIGFSDQTKTCRESDFTRLKVISHFPSKTIWLKTRGESAAKAMAQVSLQSLCV
ncbi:hypothetical protein Spb1_11460 [Planctopirus ephydatiae]|uniref:Uncharacterized protein n=1 Tax=Planctopirus ephydatiae TaxID=2528019 RepID=A0A518GL48_9PLAN|nr:hypothetical protein Spb1_11460 [Planctopirus ephydatiae]